MSDSVVIVSIVTPAIVSVLITGLSLYWQSRHGAASRLHEREMAREERRHEHQASAYVEMMELMSHADYFLGAAGRAVKPSLHLFSEDEMTRRSINVGLFGSQEVYRLVDRWWERWRTLSGKERLTKKDAATLREEMFSTMRELREQMRKELIPTE